MDYYDKEMADILTTLEDDPETTAQKAYQGHDHLTWQEFRELFELADEFRWAMHQD